MSSKKNTRTEVRLPNATPHVSLSPTLARLILEIAHSGSAGINSLVLQERGHISPARNIAHLKSHGFDISTERIDVIDSQGHERKRIANYTLKGIYVEFNYEGGAQ